MSSQREEEEDDDEIDESEEYVKKLEDDVHLELLHQDLHVVVCSKPTDNNAILNDMRKHKNGEVDCG